MNFAQVVETSVTITDNSPFKDYIYPDDQTTLLKLGLFFEPLSDKILIILQFIFVEDWCYFWKVESDLASLIYDTRTDLHQKKLKHSRQTTETVKTYYYVWARGLNVTV